MHFGGFCFPHSYCSAAFEWDADERGWTLPLTPTEPLEPGDYMLDIPIVGMFSGREYYYFRLDPAILALPPMAQNPNEITVAEAGDGAAKAGGASSGWLEAFPLSSALISALMALVMLRHMRQRCALMRRPGPWPS